MTLAHLSDTHLGYRSYGRNTADGINQREVDVMKTFQACLRAIADRKPDLIIHSGDLFNSVRPSNMTVVATFRAISRLQDERNGKPFVIIGGNHDTPKVTDSGNILKLFESIPGVIVSTDKVEVREIEALDLEMMCVPDNSLRQRENIDYSPVTNRKNRVLAIHGVEHSLMRTGIGDIDIAETQADQWQYVALGDFHIFKQYGPNCCYSGSTDYTSSNIWEEATLAKGWVWFDTDERKIERVTVEPRKVLDLPKIDALKLDPAEVTKRMLKAADWANDLMPIVRQRIINAHPSLRPKLNFATIKEISSRALHYQIDLTPPEALARTTIGGQVGSTRSLIDSWEEHAMSAQIPPQVDRNELRTEGTKLLTEVQIEADPAQA